MATMPTPTDLLDRIRLDVERNALRARNGLKHLAGVGRPEVGCTPKDIVWRRDKVQLYRYQSPGPTLGPPILLVMSLVSKPYVLDLRPGNSFVEALVARGFDVFMIDWGTPDAADADNGFETYCDEYIPFACAAAMRTQRRRGTPRLRLLLRRRAVADLRGRSPGDPAALTLADGDTDRLRRDGRHDVGPS